MKHQLAFLMALIGIFVSAYAIAGCSSCGSSEMSCNTCPYDTVCQCTDPGVNQGNDCLSRCRYCEAFGNIGAR